MAFTIAWTFQEFGISEYFSFLNDRKTSWMARKWRNVSFQYESSFHCCFLNALGRGGFTRSNSSLPSLHRFVARWIFVKRLSTIWRESR
jgi:hypothetical protein